MRPNRKFGGYPKSKTTLQLLKTEFLSKSILKSNIGQREKFYIAVTVESYKGNDKPNRSN